MASEFLNLRKGVALPEGSPVIVECLKALERKHMDLEDRCANLERQCAKLETELHGAREPEVTAVPENTETTED